jgi:hypothetical protein
MSSVYLVPYELSDPEDVADCRNFLLGGPGWDENLRKRDDPEGVGKKKLRPPYVNPLTVEEMMEIIAMTIDNTRVENRDIWDKFIKRMIRPKIRERETRSRFPWGVWRMRRLGEIRGAPALFGGIVLREEGGFYQIHEYPNPDDEGGD